MQNNIVGKNEMKYCINCGNQLNGEKFCPKCGAAVETETEKAPESTSVGGNGAIKKVILGVAVIAVVVVACVLFSGRSYKKVVKDYMKATIKADSEKLVSLLPDSVVDCIIDDDYDGDRDEMMDDIDDTLDDIDEQLYSYGVKTSDISYKIKDAKDMPNDDIHDLEKEYRKAKIKIKKAKKVEVEITIPQNDKKNSTTVEIGVAKIGRSWYLIDFDF